MRRLSRIFIFAFSVVSLLSSQAPAFFECYPENNSFNSDECRIGSWLMILSSSFDFADLGRSLPMESEYYVRFEDASGIEIKASNFVDPKALVRAKEIIVMMLKKIRPDIAARLVSKKASLAIIPRDKFVTSLPEFSRLSGRIDVNGNPYDSFKIRGLGAKGQPVTATSEENLLKLPNDRFKAEDITVHEFAHAIMNLGFASADFNRINELFKKAADKDYFPGTFARTRVDEFWAELTQSFFCVNNEIGGPEKILERDSDSYNFLEKIYNHREGIQ